MERKQILQRYPFLAPYDYHTTTRDYSGEYINGVDDLPNGWQKLFLQMCEDIRQPLIEANMLDTFYFSQIKEKYGSMRAYHYTAPKEVVDIINSYEYISNYVCENCSKPATFQTRGWITNFCEECHNNYCGKDSTDISIKYEPISSYTRFTQEGKEEIKVDTSDIWNRLYN